MSPIAKKLYLYFLAFSILSRTQDSRPRPRWSRGHKARGQGQEHKKNPRPRPRTALPRTDPLKAKDQGHRRKCSPKKRSSKSFFRQSPEKTLSKNSFLAMYKILTIQKILLSSNRRQGNFRGNEASRPRTSKCVLEDVFEAKDFKMCPRGCLRGQGRSEGLHLCIISLERASNNLACALQFFLCLFCARFALLKTGLSNRNLTKKGLKIELFF